MIAHIVHDDSGTIKSIVFQRADVAGGELAIHTNQDGDSVTPVDLGETFPERAIDGADETSRHELHLLARDLKTSFRLDPGAKKLERVS